MLEQFVTELLDSFEKDFEEWQSSIGVGEQKNSLKHQDDRLFSKSVEGFVGALIAGIKASKSIPSKINQPTQILDKLAEVKRQEEVAYLQHVENNGVRMVELVDGTNGPVTFFEIENKMPVSARMFINGRIYQLQQDGKMHYMKEETELHRKKDG